MNTIQFLGIPFHLYGLIAGIGLVGALLLIETAWKVWMTREAMVIDSKVEQRFWRVVMSGLVGGVIGARLWHVATDWPLYVGNWLAVAYLWQGGLSILGAVVGGVIGIGLFEWRHSKNWRSWQKSLLIWFDLAVLGLPIGQAIGRLGNFVNQELYGLPSQAPWAIFISEQNRLVGYESFSRYHPLFAYEAILLLVLGGGIWWLFRSMRSKQWKVGKGNLFLVYIIGYSFMRFSLEFLRIDKALFLDSALGVNQVILLVVLITSLVGYLTRRWREVLGIGGMVVLILFALFVGKGLVDDSQSISPSPPTISQQLAELPDHTQISLFFDKQEMVVEVVNTPASITQGLSGRREIGSEGMLFVFPKSQQATFWMKEMQFDLDLVWIDDGMVVGITPEVPAPDPQTPLQLLPRYQSPQEVEMVLEVVAGSVEDWGIAEGDLLYLK